MNPGNQVGGGREVILGLFEKDMTIVVLERIKVVWDLTKETFLLFPLDYYILDWLSSNEMFFTGSDNNVFRVVLRTCDRVGSRFTILYKY